MNRFQGFIFFTFLELSLGKHITIKRGLNFTFPLPENREGTSIIEVEWKYLGKKNILLARISLNKSQESKTYNRSGLQTMDNGTLFMEDIKDEDSGNYSCTFIFQNQRTQTDHIYLQVLHDQYPEQHSTVQNSYTPPDPHDPDISLIAIPVCSALSVILIVATIVSCWCRKKCCCTSKEPIYINTDVVRKTRK